MHLSYELVRLTILSPALVVMVESAEAEGEMHLSHMQVGLTMLWPSLVVMVESAGVEGKMHLPHTMEIVEPAEIVEPGEVHVLMVAEVEGEILLIQFENPSFFFPL